MSLSTPPGHWVLVPVPELTWDIIITAAALAREDPIEFVVLGAYLHSRETLKTHGAAP